MRGLTRSLLAALGALIVFSIVAEPVLAQQRQRGQRRGQRRGFGRGGFQFRGGPAFLLGNPQVQEELKLSDAQKKDVQAMLDEQRAGFQALRDIEDRDERQKKATELGKKSEESLKKILETLNEQQRTRLSQIELQSSLRFGSTASILGNEENAKKLKLTEEQKKKLADLAKDSAEALSAARQDLQGPDLFAVMRDIREGEREEAMSILTEEQKQQWTAMLGKPFELQFRGFGRGGGPGQRGGQPGRRRRPQQEP